jgi:hypothetical protein
MVTCQFAGNADMYGLGIRIGFYLQWYAAIIASWLARSEVPGLRINLAFFISATLLALIIQTAQNNLQIVEIYIILLLTFGSYLSLVPVFAWRLVTGCNPYMDPSRFPLVDPGGTTSDLHVLLLLSVVSFQLWYWFARVPQLASESCQEWGFLFTKIALNNVALQVINIVLNFILGTIVLSLAVIRAIKFMNRIDDEDEGKRWRDNFTDEELWARISLLHNLDSLFKLITASIVIVAGELTIRWNHISGVNDISSAGQLIPFVIGAGSLLRIFYVNWKRGPAGDGEEPGDSYVDTRVPVPFDRMPLPFGRVPLSYAIPPMESRPGRVVMLERRGGRPHRRSSPRERDEGVIVSEEDEEIVIERRTTRPVRPLPSRRMPIPAAPLPSRYR